MSSLVDLPELVGFFSYSRSDDEHSQGALSRLRARIQNELRLQLGRRFRLWQDTAAIPEGALWEEEIKRAIAESVFFIPIVTPSAVASEHCRLEFESFLKREAELGRSNLIFPLLYVRVPRLESEQLWRQDDILKIIGTRQYMDWQRLRHLELNSTEASVAIERFCGNIFSALSQPCVSPEERRKKEAEEARGRAERERLAREAEVMRRAEEASKKEGAEARQRAQGENARGLRTEVEARLAKDEERRKKEQDTRRREEAEAKRRAEQDQAFAEIKNADNASARAAAVRRTIALRRVAAGAAVAIALMLVAWVGLYQFGVAVWTPWTAGPVQPDPAVEAKRKVDEEAAARMKTEEEAAAIKKAEEEAAAKKASEEEARRSAEEAERQRIAALKVEAERKRAEEEARRDPALAVQPGSGQSFRDRLVDGRPCPTCPEMVVVPAGAFMMGSPLKEKGREHGVESPQHKVTIASPLVIGKFSITRGEFAAFVKETDYRTEGGCYVSGRSDGGLKPYLEQDDRHPVVCVNWNDAKAFAAWLSRKVGKPYRLLTEAEREYAARAGTTTRFSFGDAEAVLAQYAWYSENSSEGTHPVGEKKPNAFGLFDMHGNVMEWVEDCYHSNYNGAPIDGSSWTSGDCSFRVVRGGSWFHDPLVLRSAARGRFSTDDRLYTLGFRVGRTLIAP